MEGSNGQVRLRSVILANLMLLKSIHILKVCVLHIFCADGKPPVDSSTIVVHHLYVSTGLYAAMSVLAIIGIIQAVCFLVFNTMFRTKRCDNYISDIIRDTVVKKYIYNNTTNNNII